MPNGHHKSVTRHQMMRAWGAGDVANFAEEVMKGQLPLSVGGLAGHGVEQFGHLVSRLPLEFTLTASHRTPDF